MTVSMLRVVTEAVKMVMSVLGRITTMSEVEKRKIGMV